MKRDRENEDRILLLQSHLEIQDVPILNSVALNKLSALD